MMARANEPDAPQSLYKTGTDHLLDQLDETAPRDDGSRDESE
jgi:hypothetical protein